MSNFKHQGDVPLYPYHGEMGTKIEHSGSFVLALGEQTGHKHVIIVERPDQMEVSQLSTGEYVLKLKSQATITHEEHLPITVEPGIYRVGKEREFDHFANTVRTVID